MDARNIEPRTVLWAVAEISWEDQTGTPYHAPATLEDISVSGACIRVKTPVTVGSKLVVKWQREQFFAVARNCRSDGRDFLLGVRRDSNPTPSNSSLKNIASPQAPETARPESTAGVTKVLPPPPTKSPSNPAEREKSTAPGSPPELASRSATAAGILLPPEAPRLVSRSAANALHASPGTFGRAEPVRSSPSQPQGASPRRERRVMQFKGFFPKFWRQHDDTDAPHTIASTEAPVNKSQTHPAEGLTGPQTDLLSYEDIYRAAGILSPRSGYGIHKVVDMLNSDRIRNLSPDIKRASVFMALDAAGTSADDLLQEPTRRQQALSSYEAGQQKQLEEFEARKAQENAQIQAEMERVTAHYAERIQHNHDQVAQEKEALHNWQIQKQYENQRISEVIELCAKPAPSAPLASAAAASSGAPVGPPASSAPALPNRNPEVSIRK